MINAHLSGASKSPAAGSCHRILVAVGFWVCLCLSCLVGVPDAYAQDEPSRGESAQVEAPSASETFSVEHRKELYEKGKKSTGRALLLTLLLPPLADIYAEQYLWAGVTTILLVFAATFASYGLVTDQPTFLTWAAVTGGISYATGGVTSVLGVQAYNRELRRALKVSQVPALEFSGPALSFHW